MAVKTYSYAKDKNVKLSKHFSVYEFRCKDGTDKILINTDLITVLEKLHTYLNCKAIIINSGYRTPSYCVKIGSFKNSQHTKGNAADIKCQKQNGSYYSSNEVCCALEDLGHMGGIGKINNVSAVHVDVRGYKSWFDETNNEKTCQSWYTYLGIKKPRAKGDVDGNGTITASDARMALRASADLTTLTKEQQRAADMNGDGKITAKDAKTILEIISGKL